MLNERTIAVINKTTCSSLKNGRNVLVYSKRVLTGVPSYQLTTNFSAN